MGKIKDIFIKILNDNNGEYPVGYTLQQYLEDEEKIKYDQENANDQRREEGDDLLS
jgi:hypothetical protein